MIRICTIEAELSVTHRLSPLDVEQVQNNPLVGAKSSTKAYVGEK